MSTRTIESLQAQLIELQAIITAKREELGAVLADGRQDAKLTAEIAQLEAEAGALPAAIEHSKRKAAELAAFKAAQAKEAEDWARGELAKAEVKAAKALAELGKQLDQIAAMRARISGMPTSLLSSRFVGTVRGEIDRLKTNEPELMGLPPRRTPEELRRIELQGNIDRAAARLRDLEEKRADPTNPLRYSVKNDMLDAAKDDLRRAKEALAELQ